MVLSNLLSDPHVSYSMHYQDLHVAMLLLDLMAVLLRAGIILENEWDYLT